MHILKFVLAGIFLTTPALGHEGHKPHLSNAEKIQVLADAPDQLLAIQTAYDLDVKPIFQNKCFDCHSTSVRYPWYYPIPGVKQFIDDDIKEARRHLEMSKGFPFESRHGMAKDLEELTEVIEQREMPPKLYLLMHGEAKLTDEEVKTILSWVAKAKSSLTPP